VNKSEFAERVLAAEKTLYHISKSILKNGDDCADAVQEAILIAYRKLHSLRDERFFKTWLCRILINVCCKMARERKKVVSFEEYMAPEQAAETSRPDLYEAIMALPRRICASWLSCATSRASRRRKSPTCSKFLRVR
jgi:RNA polymerase sigma-70 factor (ECF subfamily)